ncbi:aromatic acid exporter family protein [Hazenella coriacea]|uniref:Uncharacterized membrane protein YgaE (UPF0421/DUF939 family) n=1 Tax=Hazenella coriacea TaxID=1179467 RepID=A0A4R3LGN9_9BACL|nr:aromatic acid exporter family protein [Hazenella coriacea]TCS96676.1 uncharacterized membrane protein YgaE (UPF0421/DUF939 family) [Hazenella coriacea]
MKIGYRTLKTAIGTGLSIAIAQWLGLQFYTSAGIITILCIQPTKKRSYRSAFERVLGCLMAIFLAGILFEMIGYSPWALSLLLLIHIPLSVFFNTKEGIVTSTVIMLHIYLQKSISIDLVLNELALIVIGVGVALIINLYMPNVEKQLKQYQQDLESNFRKILNEISVYLRKGESDWDGREITETAQLLKEAKHLALLDIENSGMDEEYSYYRYFEMREHQFEILERIMPIVSSLEPRLQSFMIADFFDRVADAVQPGNTATIYLDELEELRKKFKQTPLPLDREEFETRAALVQFVNEMGGYLILKRDLIKEEQKDQKKKRVSWKRFFQKSVEDH